MKQTTSTAALVIMLMSAVIPTACSKSKVEIMAVTGATPTAYKVDAPGGFDITVDGMVKRTYAFTARALNALPSVWLRTREISPAGEFLGTYAYTGVPLIAILDGVAPEKPKGAAFDRPVDMTVTFTSTDGKKAVFSYGELTMTDDSLPVILAFDRRQVLPTDDKTRKTYGHNRFKDALKGLRLVCPADPDTARCLDNVVRITLGTPAVDVAGLPVMKKGSKCASAGITGHWRGKAAALSMAGVPRLELKNWVRTGHGRGFKSMSAAAGFSLRETLRKNFPGCGMNNFFLFVSCDGYRTLLSGREIFLHDSGRAMMIIDRIDGKKTENGPMLGPVKDYFVDRDVWGLSHIVVLDGVE